MDLPQVDTCCFGLIPLKTGSIIIGIICFIAEFGVHGYETIYAEEWLRTLYSILIVCGIISSALLVWGVLSDNKFLVKIYLIVFALLIICTIALLVLVLLRTHRNNSDFIMSTIIYVCVIGYCLIVVNSYYKIMP